MDNKGIIVGAFVAGMATTYVLQKTNVFGAESVVFNAWDKDGYKTNARKNFNGKTASINKCEVYSCGGDYVVRMVGNKRFTAKKSGVFNGQGDDGKWRKALIIFKKGDSINIPNQIKFFKTSGEAKRYVSSLNRIFGLSRSKANSNHYFYWTDYTTKGEMNALKIWNKW